MSQCLYPLLQRAAAAHGPRPAVEFLDRRITYADLLDAADRLAGWLADRGAGPGRQAAFCFHKSIDAIVALFGLIRVGATYVPLDPSWPPERLASICRDAGVHAWLGTGGPPAGLPPFDFAVCSNPGDSAGASFSEVLRHAPARGDPAPPRDDLANLLFTSGSTGRPKGVQITSLSLLHFSRWAVDCFGLTCDDRLANHAPYNFDLSTLDIFAAVRCGATMCPVPERLKMFPYQLVAFIAERRISVWYSVPSALVMMELRGSLPAHDLRALRHVIFAGEVMPKPALQKIAPAIPLAAFTNLYGPTETNACTFHRVTPEDLACADPVPVGRAIADTRLWIVDENSRSVPAAGGGSHPATGELWVAGPTVTTGYFGDAELTAARLVPSPDGLGRAYRTGDRVTLRPDGVLMFEGRMDRMVKVRGHRVEPGEIEAALSRHPAVKEVAVVPVHDPVFGSRLRACLSLRDGAIVNEAELVSFCRERLPAYMLPDRWAFFDSLPRTDREKIDYRALAN